MQKMKRGQEWERGKGGYMTSSGQTTCLTKTHIAEMPEDHLSLNALSKRNAGPEKSRPTVSPLAFEHNYVMQETVGQSKPWLKTSSPKLKSPIPIKPQAHQTAATDLQAVANICMVVCPHKKVKRQFLFQT